MAALSVRNIEAFNTRVRKAQSRGERLARTVQTGFDDRHRRGRLRAAGDACRDDAVHRRRRRRVRRPDDRRRQGDRSRRAAAGADGACRRHPPHHGDAAARRSTSSPAPSRPTSRRASASRWPPRSTAARSSTSRAPSSFSARATCSIRSAWVRSSARMARSSPTRRSSALPKRCARQGYARATSTDITRHARRHPMRPATDPRTAGEDDLYDMAVAIVLRDRKASTSYIQRRLSIGYNRAADLIERMETRRLDRRRQQHRQARYSHHRPRRCRGARRRRLTRRPMAYRQPPTSRRIVRRRALAGEFPRSRGYSI